MFSSAFILVNPRTQQHVRDMLHAHLLPEELCNEDQSCGANVTTVARSSRAKVEAERHDTALAAVIEDEIEEL